MSGIPSSVDKVEQDCHLENNPLYSYNNTTSVMSTGGKHEGEDDGNSSLHVYDTIDKVVM